MRGADWAEWDEFDRSSGGRSPEELKRLVRYQQWVIRLVLAQLVLWVCWGLVSGAGRGPSDWVRLLLIVVFLTTGAFVFLLETTLHDAVAGLFGGLLSLIPGLGLLFVMMANRGASAELKKHGLEVGFFGARLADVADRWSPYDIDEETGW